MNINNYKLYKFVISIIAYHEYKFSSIVLIIGIYVTLF